MSLFTLWCDEMVPVVRPHVLNTNLTYPCRPSIAHSFLLVAVLFCHYYITVFGAFEKGLIDRQAEFISQQISIETIFRNLVLNVKLK